MFAKKLNNEHQWQTKGKPQSHSGNENAGHLGKHEKDENRCNEQKRKEAM